MPYQTPTGRDATLPRVRSLALIGAVVFALACVVFGIARSHADLHPPYPKSEAPAAARRDSQVRAALRGSGWDSARVIPLDRRHWRVTFFPGPRQVVDAAVGPDGRVDAVELHTNGVHPPGSVTLWTRPVLLLFSALFV